MRTIACLILAVLVLPIVVGAQEPPPAEVAADAPAAPPARWISFWLGPIYSVTLDDDSHDMLGDLYGGALALKVHPIPWLAVALRGGYQIGYAKRDQEMGYLRYRQVTAAGIAPVLLGVSGEILPRGRVNPYVTGLVGATYFALQQEPENIDTPVPVDHDELARVENEWLLTYGGEVGVDVRITEWVGAYLAASWLASGDFAYDVAIPGESARFALDPSRVSGSLGVVVYY